MMQLCHSGLDRPAQLSACRAPGETLHTAEGMPRKSGLSVRLLRDTILAIAVLGGLTACQGDAAYQNELREQRQMRDFQQSPDSIFDLLRYRSDPDRGVIVNRYLWQASLDVLAFLPLESADPFSGLIVTGWGRAGNAPGAYRVTVYISEPSLDALALQVAAFRQQGGGAVAVTEAENDALENAILTRARQMRIAAAEQ